MINRRQLETVEAHVTEARERGAEILTGGRRLTELGPGFYAPTIVVNVSHSMRLMREETFGPVLPVMAVADEEEAVRLANDSEFGLAASIWTSDRRRGQRIARQLQAGTVSINDALTGFATAEAPHGGVKASGIGRTHGRFGLEEMVWPKYVDTDLLPRLPKVWWYGYGLRFTRQVEGFIDFLFARGAVRRMRSGLRALPSMFRKRF
jgi:succinate-semialdehyde dehydrogenase/glutarate-semialdehyde dehydrogenase